MKGKALRHWWTKDEVIALSKTLAGQGRGALIRANRTAYNFALRHNLLDQMPWLGVRPDIFSGRVYSVYEYNFPDGMTYVGITINEESRHRQHETGHGGSAVYGYAKTLGIPVPCMSVIARRLTQLQARDMEHRRVSKYQKQGRSLNRAKTGPMVGSVGAAVRRWTRPRVVEAAKKCKNIRDMSIRFRGAYAAAKVRGWLRDLFPVSARKPKGYWTRVRVFAEAKKYHTRVAFMRGAKTAYMNALREGWLDQLIPPQHKAKRPGTWAFEAVRKYVLSQGLTKRSDLMRSAFGAYKAAWKRGWLDQLFPKKGKLK